MNKYRFKKFTHRLWREAVAAENFRSQNLEQIESRYKYDYSLRCSCDNLSVSDHGKNFVSGLGQHDGRRLAMNASLSNKPS